MKPYDAGDGLAMVRQGATASEDMVLTLLPWNILDSSQGLETKWWINLSSIWTNFLWSKGDVMITWTSPVIKCCNVKQEVRSLFWPTAAEVRDS